jgi:hypoxanthine phosphoribosyltransferase
MNPNEVEVHDKKFKIFITRDEIRTRVKEMAWQISKDYKGKAPIFISILNGSFMFTADLVRDCKFDSELMFVGISSYEGMESTEKVSINYGLKGDKLKGKDLIIIEDIIDTGTTLSHFIETIKEYEPASIAVASLLHKPNAIRFDIPLDYIGYRIPNAFVVGYGLDYDGLGRTLADVYQLAEE